MSSGVNDVFLEKLRRGNLNKEITSLIFDHPDIFGDISDIKEEEVIDKLCDGLELLKTNIHIRDLAIHRHIRRDKEKDDAKGLKELI